MTCEILHHSKYHYFVVLGIDFINWDLLLAAWVSISVNIGKLENCVAPTGGHDHSRSCNTIYSALAFTIVEWLLFTVTFFSVIMALWTGKEVPVRVP